MIEASVSTGVDVEDRVAAECSGHRSSRTSNHKLSARDILDNTIMFLFDETSKNTLAHISYLLAINPDIQLKLQDEIETFYKENPVSFIPVHSFGYSMIILDGLFELCRRPSCMKQQRKLATLITLYKKVFVSILLQ